MGAVSRAFAVLDVLSRAPGPLGTSEVARRLHLAKSTTHGLLQELASVGALEATRGGYRIGPALERLATASELRRRWRPALERLAAESGETAFLGQARGSRVAVLDEVLGTGAPVVSAPIGSRLTYEAGVLAEVMAGATLAIDRGRYLEGVNAVGAPVPGGAVWVAGFARRLTDEKLAAVADLLARLTTQA